MADLPLIHPDADRLHHFFRTQPLQRPPRAVHRLLEHLGLLASACEDVDVVDEAHVHAFQPQSLQAVLESAHRAVVAIVEMHGEGGGIRPGRKVDGLAFRGAQQPTHLGSEDEVVPRLPAQGMAGAQLGKPVAVHRRGVEEAHAGLPGVREHRFRRRLVDLAENIAERGGSETEGGHLQIRPAEFTLLSRMHSSPP